MLGVPVYDCTTGFRCYRYEVLQSIDLDSIQSQGYAFQVELVYRVMKQGFKIVEIPIVFKDRSIGKSKMSRKIVIEALTYVLHARFSIDKKSDRTQSSLVKSAQRTVETASLQGSKGR
jgi:dolichol-phosphate mannosyltransferase